MRAERVGGCNAGNCAHLYSGPNRILRRHFLGAGTSLRELPVERGIEEHPVVVAAAAAVVVVVVVVVVVRIRVIVDFQLPQWGLGDGMSPVLSPPISRELHLAADKI